MLLIDTDLHELLPEYYQGIADYDAMLTTEEAELAELVTFIEAVYNNFFVQRMDESTVASWEQLLGISGSAEQSLEFRRQRVLNRISTRPPFTLPFLYARLDELIGPGKWEVVMDYGDQTLYIESAAESQEYAVEVAYTVNQIKPAHIVYINRPLITADVLESEEVSGSVLTYNYRLGSWALGSAPFASESEERVYKMATTNSLTSRFIGNVASQVSTMISKARINETYIPASISKSVADGLVTVMYTIPQGTVTTITKIELLDSSNNVLTSSNVYIPATTAVELKHKILTKEGV